MKRHRDNIAMVKLNIPKKMSFPNGRIFYEKYKRVKINSLPDNIRTRQRYRRKYNNNQQQHRLKNKLRNGFNLTKRAARSKIARNLAKIAIENVPEVYKKDVSKVKNRKLKNTKLRPRKHCVGLCASICLR